MVKGPFFSGAKGRRFESCEAYQLQHDVLNTSMFQPSSNGDSAV